MTDPVEVTDVADIVLARWKEILGADNADPADDFFLSGGSSLLAIRLINQLREDLRVRLRVLTIFEHSTLGEFVREVERST